MKSAKKQKKKIVKKDGSKKIPIKKESEKKLIRARVPSGIKNFDSLVQGGFEKDSTNLIVATSGSGKTIFSMQFLIEGIRREENCLYITFEEKKEEFYSNMKEFGWNLEKLEKQGKFFFLEYTPEKVKTMLEEGGGTIETLVLTKKIKRIVIDSLTSFGLLFENDLEKRKSAIELFNMLRKWDCTSVLTYERDPLKDPKTTSRVLEFESDSIIILYFVRDRKSRGRFLEILKMRGTNHSKQIWPFEIEKGGIAVKKNSFKGDLNKFL